MGSQSLAYFTLASAGAGARLSDTAATSAMPTDATFLFLSAGGDIVGRAAATPADFRRGARAVDAATGANDAVDAATGANDAMDAATVCILRLVLLGFVRGVGVRIARHVTFLCTARHFFPAGLGTKLFATRGAARPSARRARPATRARWATTMASS